MVTRIAIWRPLLAALLFTAALIGTVGIGQQPVLAQEQGRVPGGALGNQSDPDFWRAVRQGDRGTVSIPNQQAGVLIQSEGDNWRAFRNGPLSTYGAWGLLGIVALLALFFALRGRIRIEEGRSGQTITQIWNGMLSTSGSTATVTNVSYNGSLPPGGSTTFGFLANGSASTPTITCTSP